MAAAAALGLLLSASTTSAPAADPIKIGVIGEESAVAGASITKAAQMAADDINAHGGVNGRQVQVIIYDDHSSASEAVRAFQRAVSEDKVVAVIGSYISEVALAIQPWSARMKMPYITPGAASTDISKHVHDDYATNKYSFDGWLNSAFIAQSVCDFQRDMIVKDFHAKTTVIMSEDAAWTKPLDERYEDCLPKAGLKVLDHIRFNPDTTDFTPIFNKIESQHPDVITTGISHVGVQPTVQWHDQHVPIAMTGQSSQATTSTFWKDTNGGAEGVITATAAGPGVALTPSTVAFVEAYEKKFGASPAYCGLLHLRRDPHDRGDHQESELDRSRQDRRRARKDALHRRARHDRVLRGQGPVHTRARVRARPGHRQHHPVAERQASHDLSARQGERKDQVPRRDQVPALELR